MTAAVPAARRARPIELWWQDEARVGQQGTVTRVWAPRGSRPRRPKDQRYSWAYLFGAVCPARDLGAALVLPSVNTSMMNRHLAEISSLVQPGHHAVVILDGAPSRGGQLRRGAEAARGAWLLVIHADTVLPEGWTRAAQAQMGDGRPAAFRLSFDAAGIRPALVAGWANLRSRAFGLPYGDQGLLIAREDYEAAGGYPDIPLMEDVALVRSLKRRITLMPLAVTTASDRYARAGWLRRGARNLWTLARYLFGADPHRLAARYGR